MSTLRGRGIPHCMSKAFRSSAGKLSKARKGKVATVSVAEDASCSGIRVPRGTKSVIGQSARAMEAMSDATLGSELLPKKCGSAST